jgi:hypothetical protein
VVDVLELLSNKSKADVNEDGEVDELDLDLVRKHYTDSAEAGDKADLNGDGKVDDLDQIVVQSIWGPSEKAKPNLPALPVCCKAMTAECMACARNTTEAAICALKPKLAGCTGTEEAVVCDKVKSEKALRLFVAGTLDADQDGDERLTERDEQILLERVDKTDSASLKGDLNGDGTVDECDGLLLRAFYGLKASTKKKPAISVRDEDGGEQVALDSDGDPRPATSKPAVKIMDREGKSRMEIGSTLVVKDKRGESRIEMDSEDRKPKLDVKKRQQVTTATVEPLSAPPLGLPQLHSLTLRPCLLLVCSPVYF